MSDIQDPATVGTKDGSVEFGALSPPLSVQFNVPAEVLKIHDRAAENIVFLSVHGYLTDGERHKARSRLVKDIEKAVSGYRQELRKQIAERDSDAEDSH